jgi:hypothetical protein
VQAGQERVAHILRRCRSRLVNRLASKTFNAWTGFAHDRSRQRRLAEKVFGRALSGRAWAAFSAWAAAAAAAKDGEARAKREAIVVERFGRRLKAQLAVRALNAWVDATHRRRHARAVVRRTVARATSAKTAAAWWSWVMHTAAGAEGEQRAQRAGGKLHRCVVAAAARP